MNKTSKPFPTSVVPRQLPRRALVAATALAGFALTGTPAIARGSAASLETCTTSGDICSIWVEVATAALWIAAVAAITGLIGLWKFGRHPCQISPAAPTCAVLAACIALGAGAWIATGSPILFAPASSLPGAASQTVQFQ